MMPLPLPTVSNVDTTAAQLQEVERRRAMPVPNIAGAAVDSLKVASAVTEMTEAERKRQEAQDFQKNFVDKGWEGYDKVWKDAGSPPAAAPQIVRASVGDSPMAAFKYLGDVTSKAEAKTAVTAYEDAISKGVKDPVSGAYIKPTDEQLSALAIAAGKASGDGYKAVDAERTRMDKRLEGERKTTVEADKISSRERVATQRANTAREVARIRREGAKLDGANKADLDYFTQTAEDLEKEVADIYEKYPTGYGITDVDKNVVASKNRQRDDALRNANILIRKGANSKDAVNEEDSARAAIKEGAPAEAVYDRYKTNTGKRHPDDKRK